MLNMFMGVDMVCTCSFIYKTTTLDVTIDIRSVAWRECILASNSWLYFLFPATGNRMLYSRQLLSIVACTRCQSAEQQTPSLPLLFMGRWCRVLSA